jgi:hypothetical protein
MGPPTLIVYRSIRDESNANRQNWDAGITLSPVEIKGNWWIAAIGFSDSVFPGYTYKWRFYAWSKYENGTVRINEDSESFWSYKMGTNTETYGYWPAYQTYSPGSAIYIAGYANEKWIWWFDIVEINPILYTLTIINNNGLPNSTFTHYYDSSVTITAGTRTGYTFAYFTSNFGNIYSGIAFTWNRASNETLTSVWTPISYRLTVVNYEGLANTTTNHDYDSSVTITAGTRTGYTFAYFTSNFGNIYSGRAFTWNRASNETLTSVWTIKKYFVTFNNNNIGTPTSSIEYDYNTVITLPIFKAVGYIFNGWAETNNGNKVSYTSFILGDGSRSFFALWTQTTFIKFSELATVFNGTRGNTVLPDRGATSISIGKFRTESGQSGTNQIKLITNFRGKG